MAHANEPPGLPEVTDEAGDSPMWLPALGLGILIFLILLVVRPGSDSDAADAAADATEAPSAAPADEAGEDEPPEVVDIH